MGDYENICEAFPELVVSGFDLTSEATVDYNCYAWAAGFNQVWWEPDPMEIYRWPIGIERSYSLRALIQVYKSFGFEDCLGEEREAGQEKIAIYFLDGRPQHAARQLDTGMWTSKLGNLGDVSHTLHGLEDGQYGKVVKMMQRPRVDESL